MTSQLVQLIGAAAQRHGQRPEDLLRVGQIESSLNPNAKNPNSSAGGLFQFIDSTAGRYGLTNKFDPAASADAAARLMRDNAAYLTPRLGRAPTGAELYLAHQQGAGGAAKILSNPAGDAAATVGGAAVSLNGGRPGMTNADFANIWARKFDGTKMAMPPGTNGPETAAVPALSAAPAELGDVVPVGVQNARSILQADALRRAQDATLKREQDEEAEKSRKRALYGSVASLYG